jgi:glycosyltransferase involved in cell wall biosynthesis
MKVSQVLCAAGPVDAVTNQALACRRLFDSWGWDGADYSAVIAPTMNHGLLSPLRGLHAGPDEVVLIHYSGYTPELERLFDRPGRRLIISHNITPARFFWEQEPFEGVRCSLGPGQLAALASRADAVAGVSEYNAAELRRATGREDVGVIPILFDRSELGVARAAGSGGPTRLLFVGRLAPHKRQDLVIRAFAEYRRRYEAEARLVLVGVPMSPAYGARLRALASALAPGGVEFEHGVGSTELWERYRAAGVFVCLSEHEGFCIPLLEAFHFGVPVVARDAGAISEVVGDAGLVLSRTDDLATVVELLRIVVADAELRGELVARGRRRLDAYGLERTATALRASIEALA